MANEAILVVEDEEAIAELIQINLIKENFKPCIARSGEEGIKLIKQVNPALILLDLMLPGIDGLEVCRKVKNNPETSDIPVVMVTARGEETDIVTGLELGADDYVTKPFSPRVLIARVRAVLRRNAEGPKDEESVLTIHDLQIHPGRHAVVVNGEPVELTATEFKLLHYLARRPGWVRTRDQIVDSLHGPGYPVTDRAVDVQVVGLRKKLGRAGELIETVRGVGYRFKE